jgi:hypothetical protein
MSWADLIGRVGQARTGYQRAGELFSNARNNDADVLAQDQSNNSNTAEVVKNAGLDIINKDARSLENPEGYVPGEYPEDYYEEFAQSLFDEAKNRNGGDPEKAFEELNRMICDGYPFPKEDPKITDLRNDFNEAVGATPDDPTAAWDKVQHYIGSAYLAYTNGVDTSVGIGLLIELGNEAEQQAKGFYNMLTGNGYWGGIPEGEGFDPIDMEADIRGANFGASQPGANGSIITGGLAHSPQ